MTATTNQIKGLNYEIFIKKFLESDHSQTWLWSDIPENELRKSKLLGNWNEHRLVKKDNKINGIPDLGADILLKDNEKYILIQCKNFDSNNVTIHHLAGFYAMTLHYEMEGIVYYTSNISPNIRLLKPRHDIKYIKQEMPNNEISLQQPHSQPKLIDKPFYYQIEAYNQLKESNRSILSLPCGMGKTLTSIMIAKDYHNIVLLSPLIAYAKQNLERFQNELQSMNYQSIIVNSEGTRDSIEILKKLSKSTKNILSFTYKSVDILIEILSKLSNHIIIIDEFHNFSKNDIFESTPINKVLLSDSKIVFMSATPKFFNLEDVEYTNNHIFGNNTYSFSMARGISENFICDYEIFLPDLRITNTLTDILEEVDISDLSNDLALKAKFILRAILETGSKKCIIYLRNQEEAIQMVTILNTINEYYCVNNLFVESIISDTNSSNRTEVLQKFTENSGFSIICSVHILDECIDIPSCDSIFITYPSESKIRNIQRLCRSNRKDSFNPTKIAKIFLWCEEYNQIAILISQLKEFDDSFREDKVCIMNINGNSGGILHRSDKDYEGLYKNLDDIIISIRKFGYGIDSWKKNLKELKEFIKIKKPLAKSMDENERKNGKWLESQVFDFKHNQNIMKLPEIKQLWTEFTQQNKSLFILPNELWTSHLETLEDFIIENNRLPTQSSSESKEIINVAKWIIRNNEQMTKNEKAMKDEEIRSEWIDFKLKYSKYFEEKADSWNDKLQTLTKFIEKYGRLPYENDRKDEEYYLKIWTKTQEKIYNKNKFGNDNEKRLNFENLLSKHKNLFSKISTLNLWIDKYDQMIEYIEKHKQLPKEKVKVPDGISSTQQEEFERLKSLGVWKSNCVKNAKTNFEGKSESSSESIEKLRLWNEAKSKYPKLF